MWVLSTEAILFVPTPSNSLRPPVKHPEKGLACSRRSRMPVVFTIRPIMREKSHLRSYW